MTLFDYSSYKNFVNDWISRQPKKGHGQLRQLSLKLKINSVVMSQVFRGSRDLTLEQGLGVCQFLGLSELERDYFLLLVQKNKAGTHELKLVLESQLEKLRESAKALKNRITHQKFSDESKATFYSQWYYSAIRLAASLENLNSADSIAQHLNLERALVAKVLEFLLKNKLVVETKKGLDRGPQVTHGGRIGWYPKPVVRVRSYTMAINPASAKLRVLVVENDASQRERLVELIKGWDYEVFEALGREDTLLEDAVQKARKLR